jgi:hypothetical protein
MLYGVLIMGAAGAGEENFSGLDAGAGDLMARVGLPLLPE